MEVTNNSVCSFFCWLIFFACVYHIIVHVRCRKTLSGVRHQVIEANIENDLLQNEYVKIVGKQKSLKHVAGHHIVHVKELEKQTRDGIDAIHDEIPKHFYEAQALAGVHAH